MIKLNDQNKINYTFKKTMKEKITQKMKANNTKGILVTHLKRGNYKLKWSQIH